MGIPLKGVIVILSGAIYLISGTMLLVYGKKCEKPRYLSIALATVGNLLFWV